jgi:hypothetical protein
MKRLIVILVVVLCMLVVVAPASAKILRGTLTSGTAYPQAAPDVIWGETALVPSGVIFVNTSAMANAVSGTVLITCADSEVMPFPAKLNLSWIKWGRASWPDASGAYTVTGTFSKHNYPPFLLTVVANPETTALTMHVDTIGSAWGWDHWDFTGNLF